MTQSNTSCKTDILNKNGEYRYMTRINVREMYFCSENHEHISKNLHKAGDRSSETLDI